MRCIAECDSFEYCNNRTEAIKVAKEYLNQHKWVNSLRVYYHPETKKSIKWIGKDNGIGAIWFIVGRENTDNIINFVKLN